MKVWACAVKKGDKTWKKMHEGRKRMHLKGSLIKENIFFHDSGNIRPIYRPAHFFSYSAQTCGTLFKRDMSLLKREWFTEMTPRIFIWYIGVYSVHSRHSRVLAHMLSVMMWRRRRRRGQSELTNDRVLIVPAGYVSLCSLNICFRLRLYYNLLWPSIIFYVHSIDVKSQTHLFDFFQLHSHKRRACYLYHVCPRVSQRLPQGEFS